MAKLTDKQRKMIIADRTEGSSIRALAAHYKVSTTTIQSVLKSDTELMQKMAQKVEEKRAENTKSVLAYMDAKKEKVCGILDKFLDALQSSEKIEGATLSQIATAMGILIDKYTANEIFNSGDAESNNLFEALDSIGEEGFDDIPEIQREAEGNASVVENKKLPK